MACLIISTGDQSGTYFPLSNRPLAAGRDPAREIQIIDARVSRKHFVIRKNGDDYVICDMRSQNGVFVNGDKVEEAQLHDGDRIEVGDTTLVFRMSDDPDRTDALQTYRKGDRAYREDRTVPE